MADMHILVVLPVSAAEAEELKTVAPEATFTFKALVDDPAKIATTPSFRLADEDVASADIIIGNVPASRLSKASHLQWIQLGSAGADAYVKPGVLAPHVRISNSVGCYGPAVAEHSFALLLSLMKKLYKYEDDQRAHVWGEEGNVATLDGASILVMGAGDIGEHFALLCTAMGATCTAYRSHIPEKVSSSYQAAFAKTIAGKDALQCALPASQVVAAFLPSTPETARLVDEEFLSALPKGAYLVNAGRGDLIDYAALERALEIGALAGCAIDVADPEPLPEESPLWDCPNLLITPHVAGFWHLPKTRKLVYLRAKENLGRYLAGEELLHEVKR
ncbi:MAG: D-2-hydroxyacid dehydrogenase [Atopobiaceae bacterium]